MTCPDLILLDAAYCFVPLNAPRAQTLHMPKPVPSCCTKLQTLNRSASSVSASGRVPLMKGTLTGP